ncbi:hypothetical protein [Streptomyces sp. col6]|uniref:hypothetical protein n=1 Tax=Streptomyces sp. col6 TaxID=2478958 RepID=UPI001747B4E6|nr:hypothetical protein [Streptomyces sp. col6]
MITGTLDPHLARYPVVGSVLVPTTGRRPTEPGGPQPSGKAAQGAALGFLTGDLPGEDVAIHIGVDGSED